MTSVEEARAALAAKGAAELDLAQLKLCPPWRHAAAGGLFFLLVASPAVALPYRFVMLALIFMAMALIIRSDRRRLGVFINGYRRGKTRLVIAPMLLTIFALYFASFHYGDTLGRADISLALAAAAFAVGTIGSIVWQRVFIQELRG